MDTADTTKILPKGRGHLVSFSLPVQHAHPLALLRTGIGGPRGFWAREGRWFAHIGEAASVSADSREASTDRYAAVWGDAGHLLRGAVAKASNGAPSPNPRFFGGFSFGEEHLAEGVWAGFPSAHFVLPEVELKGGQSGGVLTLRRFVGSSAEIEEACRALQEESDRFLSSLPPASVPGEMDGEGLPKTQVETGEEDWTRMVRGSLDKIFEGELSKVVMARALTAAFPEEIDPVAVAMSLWEGNPGAHVFLFEPSDGHALVGAAPETVATVSSGTFQATAVAGSIPRGDTSEEQSALAEALLNSEKDLREHRVCVEDMVARLGTVSEEIQAEGEPHVLTLSAIQHLETLITSRLRDDETILSALRALHPTPAVCGFPRDRALALLAEAEPFSRGWYAGPVGWFDGEGDGVFVPALRSAVGSGKEWRLFAGAGIVAGSDPAKEWAETRIKFQPVLRALSESGQEPPGVTSSLLEEGETHE